MSAILAIDIGSTKICALIAQIQDSKPQLVGSGIAKASGLKKGAIVNIDQASKAIASVVADAKQQAGIDPKGAIISVSGGYVRSINSYGIANIPTKEIALRDVNRAMQTALYNANIPPDFEVLHALPYNFKVDDQNSIQDPVGMSGGRLEASVHIVIGQKTALENLRRTVQMAGVEVENMVLSGYASAIAVLNEEERDHGVCVIDIGGMTSNLVIHLGNSLRYNDFLAVGGSHITGDLSMALHTSVHAAERVKIDQGSLMEDIPDDTIEIPNLGSEEQTHPVSLEIVRNVVSARIEETLMILSRQLEKSHFKHHLGAGLVITGGASKHEGIAQMAQPIFDNLPVRVANPKPMAGLATSLNDPTFSVALGLVRYGSGEYTLYEIDSNKHLQNRYRREGAVRQEAAQKAPIQSGDELKAPLSEGDAKKAAEKESIADIMMSNDPKPESLGARIKNIWHGLKQIF